MKTPDISVIIPAYNARNTIIPCLDSVMRQDCIQDFEVIVINDGSTDNTSNIVQEYIYNRPNIKLINLKHNRGVSVARNKGIQLATGRYITFVDSDDMVGVSYDALHPIINVPSAEHFNIGPMHLSTIAYPNINTFVPTFNTMYFTNLLKVARPETNIVFGGKLTLDMRLKIIGCCVYHDAYKFNLLPCDKSIALRNAYWRENANFALYERNFLKNKALKFQPTMRLDEDILFCMQAVLHAENVITAPDATYLYFRHENSLSTPKDYWSASDLSTIQSMSVLLTDLYNYPEYSDIFYYWLNEFKTDGQVAKTRCRQFPNTICEKCVPKANKCVSCVKLQRLLNSNVQLLVKQR